MLMLPVQVLLENTENSGLYGCNNSFSFPTRCCRITQNVSNTSWKMYKFGGLCNWGHWCETCLQISTFLVAGCTYTSKFWHFNGQVHLGRGKTGTVPHQEKCEWDCWLDSFSTFIYGEHRGNLHDSFPWKNPSWRPLHNRKQLGSSKICYFSIKCPLALMCCQSRHLDESD